MELLLNNMRLVAMISGIWYVVNGVLHDIFVIKNHKGGYDRELLRLLMDGHVLILSGGVLLLLLPLLTQGNIWGMRITLLVSGAMLVYCFMIFPFLKSIGTILISSILFIIIAFNLFKGL